MPARQRSNAGLLPPSRQPTTASDEILPDGSTIEGWHALLRLALCRDGLDGMKHDAAIAATGLSTRSGYRATALSFEGLGYLAAGELDRADAVSGARVRDCFGDHADCYRRFGGSRSAASSRAGEE